MSRKKKILFASVDIGYRVQHYTDLITREFGHVLEADSFIIYLISKNHYKTNYTFPFQFGELNILHQYLIRVNFFFKALFQYDILHFLSGETILTRKLRRFELWCYKLAGKRIIMHFVGSDIRNPDFLYWKEKNMGDYLSGKAKFDVLLNWQQRLIKDSIDFADEILVSTPDLLDIIPSAHYLPVFLDFQTFDKDMNQIPDPDKVENEIVILHAPSNTNIKGTSLIHDVLHSLETNSGYKIKLILPGKALLGTFDVYPATRYDVFRYYKEADIVIDQMVIGWYGLQTVEALAAGKNVFCFIEEKYKKYLFMDCPIHVANALELEQELKKCIQDILNHKAKQPGDIISWAMKNHSIENYIDTFYRIWDVPKHK